MKTCTRCNTLKPLDAYARNRTRASGFRSMCKSCVAETRPSRAGSQASRDYWQKFYSERREEILESQRNNPARRTNARLRYATQRDEIIEKQRVYRKSEHAKALHAKVQRKRNRRLKEATPSWLTPAHHEAIAYNYWHARDASRVTGEPYQVDHIVPLRGKNVCGLHVPWNLRVVPADVNQRKHASLEVT